MANSAQARYRAKKATQVNQRRSRQLAALRTSIKRVVKISQENNPSDSKEALNEAFTQAQKALDKAASKKLIHNNKASRLKSGLAKRVKIALTTTSSTTKKVKKKSKK